MANKQRFIDATELDSKLEALAKKYYDKGNFEAAKDYSFVQTVLLSAPTVDAVPVVRCKNCEFCYYNPCSNTYRCSSMNGMNRTVEPDEFCSYGEKMDGGNENG